MKKANNTDLKNAPDWVKENMFGDFSEQDEPLGFMSGVFVLIAMVIVATIIADVATGFDLHNLLAEVMTI